MVSYYNRNTFYLYRAFQDTQAHFTYAKKAVNKKYTLLNRATVCIAINLDVLLLIQI